MTRHDPPATAAAERAGIARRFGLDPASPLAARVRPTSPEILARFDEVRRPGQPGPTEHRLTAGERRALSAAFAALPPLHQRLLRERLRGVNFLDGMPNTALTSTVNPGEPYELFDITIRAAVLRQTASEWLTEKERTVFDSSGSGRSVSVEAGGRDALVFILLHEATHVVDNCLGLTPPFPPGKPPQGAPPPPPPPTEFTRGVWDDRMLPAPAYRDALRLRVRFFPGGEQLPIDRAVAVYESLRRTPFASLYGGWNWSDDLAEYLSVYHWTEVLKQPYRIVIRDGDRDVVAYEPMKSSLVRGRIGQMKRFYEEG